jgi:organic radical activating enzyme
MIMCWVVVDVNSKQETVLRAQGGLKNPITWVDTAHAVYRVANGQETADYIISLSGGEPRKIRDVTNVAGVDRWYYY